jgi:TPR repeat protein
MLRTGDGARPATPEQALATLRANCTSATRDNAYAVACFSLGQLYDTGTFVAKDPALAMGLHDKACGLGEMRACAELGMFYDDGAVVPRDTRRAREYFRQACDGGNGRGCNNLILLHPEAATEEDIAYALDRYRAICDGGGDSEACMSLGNAYRGGKHFPTDAKRAIELYAKACTAEHPSACNNLGAMHALGEGVAKNDAEAAQLYAKACALGSREGCLNAGVDPETAPVQNKPNP